MKKKLHILTRLRIRIMAVMMGTVVPNCEETAHRISAAMDGPLPWRKRIGMRIHIFFCAFCHHYEQQLRQIRRMMRGDAQPPEETDTSGPTLSPEARERIRRTLRDSSHRD